MSVFVAWISGTRPSRASRAASGSPSVPTKAPIRSLPPVVRSNSAYFGLLQFQSSP